MSSFTPGPWEVAHGGTAKNGKFEITEYFVRKPDDDVSIAADIIDPKTGEPSEANARRICQCVNNFDELLGACKELEAAIWDSQYGKGLAKPYLHSVTDKAHKAIAKAEERV